VTLYPLKLQQKKIECEEEFKFDLGSEMGSGMNGDEL
jgi:hypothetical protein